MDNQKAKLGLVVPGLGHLLSGDPINGLGLLLHLSLLTWSAVGLMKRGFPGGENEFHLHPWIALIGMLLVAGFVWHTAYRRVYPAPYNPQTDDNSQWRELKKQFRRNRTGIIGLHLVIGLVLLALFTPFISPFDPNAIDSGEHRLSPNWIYLMGTDDFGRDIFSRVMYGGRISLSIGFIAVSISVTIGTIVGAAAGYFGGAFDKATMWFVDLLLSLPRLVLLLAIVGFFQTSGAEGIFLIVGVLGLTGWMGVSRIVRSSVLSLKEHDFVQACHALGLPNWRIICIHLIPNALAPVIVNASLAIGSTILVEAALSFLGLGVPPPTATWGAIVNDGREYMRSAPWITIAPGLLIILAVMSFNLLGDGLRDALDPKLRGRS